MALQIPNLNNIASVDFNTPHDPNAPWYPEAQLQSGGFGFQQRNERAKQIIDDLNRRVASGEITQAQANQAWAQIHEAGNEADRASETSNRQFQQHGVATIGSMALGGLLASGGTPAEGGTSGSAGATSSSPTLGQVGGAISAGNALLNGGGGGGAPGIPGAAGGGAGGTGSLIGALLGGALGGTQGGSKPAGTTTTTTAQTLAPGGLQNLQDTIAGHYLDPASNPYLNQTYDAAARQITPRVNSLFEASGRYGSGAHQGVLGQNLSDLATNIYGGNYNSERARQFQAAGTSIGNTVQNPYFTNPLAGILSGALAGGVLGGGGSLSGLPGAIGGAFNGIGNLFGSGGSTGATPGPEQLSGPGSGYVPPEFGPEQARYKPMPISYSPAPTSVDDYYTRRLG